MTSGNNPQKGGKAGQNSPSASSAPSEPDVPPAKHDVNPEAKDHWRKGNSFFEESKFEDALKEFSAAIEVDGKYADAYFNRALTNRMLKNFDGAKRDLDIVMELQPDSADAPLLIGDIAETNDDYIGARYWYEKSLKINPDYAEAKSRLEKIDALMHVNAKPKSAGPQSADQKYKPQPETKGEQQTGDVIVDGQIQSIGLYKSEIKFDSVIGLKKIKKYLSENVVLAMRQPQLFRKYGKKMGLGLILYGPPGVGKTHIVNAVAGETNANVYIARVHQLVDMYTGNTEKNIHKIFQLAREHLPIIMVFDEIDALTPKRSSGGGADNSALRLAVNAFLSEMSGIEKNPEGIYVIGTTNTPWDIDPAMKRSGRFGDKIYLTVPSYKDRKKLFEFYTRKTPKDRINYGRLARATMGYSPADIESICDKATMKPLLHEYTKQRGRNLTLTDVLSIIKDKEMSGSSLDEWYEMVKKDVITKTETQTVDGKKQEIIKEGKLDAQEKVAYKAMVNDIKKNTRTRNIRIRRFMRWWAVYLF